MRISSAFKSVNGLRFVEHCICNESDIFIQPEHPLSKAIQKSKSESDNAYHVVIWTENGKWHAAIVRYAGALSVIIFRCPSDIQTAIESIIDMIDDKMDEGGFAPLSRADYGVRGH